jgi:hypothetical protein
VLDNRFFSSIIYIWYEGGALRPLVVERLKTSRTLKNNQRLPSGRVTPHQERTMAKKAKKAAKKKAKKR